MSLSVNPVLHHYANRKSLRKVNILVIYNRMKVYASTNVSITADQFNPSDPDNPVTKHPKKTILNETISRQRNDILGKIHEAIRFNDNLSIDDLKRIVKGKTRETLQHLVDEFYASKALEPGTLRLHKSVLKKVLEYDPEVKISDINELWLIKYEKHLRTEKKNEDNTIHTNMNRIIAWLNFAVKKGKTDKKVFVGYSRPKYVQNIPEYLTESEVDKIFEVLQPISRESYRIAGYYFLLSCYAGYRLSDLKAFKHDEVVKDNRLLLMAKKNKKIVPLPIYPQLRAVLDIVKDIPFNLSEDKMREYLKDICSLAGINGRKITPHTGRHTFAMMLADKGFTIEDIAALIGDTPLITKVYAKISNHRIESLFKEKFG